MFFRLKFSPATLKIHYRILTAISNLGGSAQKSISDITSNIKQTASDLK
jgi:hypothetical protein